MKRKRLRRKNLAVPRVCLLNENAYGVAIYTMLRICLLNENAYGVKITLCHVSVYETETPTA